MEWDGLLDGVKRFVKKTSKKILIRATTLCTTSTSNILVSRSAVFHCTGTFLERCFYSAIVGSGLQLVWCCLSDLGLHQRRSPFLHVTVIFCMTTVFDWLLLVQHMYAPWAAIAWAYIREWSQDVCVCCVNCSQISIHPWQCQGVKFMPSLAFECLKACCFPAVSARTIAYAETTTCMLYCCREFITVMPLRKFIVFFGRCFCPCSGSDCAASLFLFVMNGHFYFEAQEIHFLFLLHVVSFLYLKPKNLAISFLLSGGALAS